MARPSASGPCVQLVHHHTHSEVYKAGTYVGIDDATTFDRVLADDPDHARVVHSAERMLGATDYLLIGLAVGLGIAAAGAVSSHDDVTLGGVATMGATLVATATWLLVAQHRERAAIDDYNADAEARGCRD